jgi:6-pyruvoyl-tetrahydropterin synthase
MVVDLAELDRILDSEVVSRFHHRHINTAVETFGPGHAIPSTENLAAFILEKVGALLPGGVRVHRVRVHEDRDLWSDVFGSAQGDG